MRGFVDLHLHVSLTDRHGAYGEAACRDLMQAAEQLGVKAMVITPHVDAYQPAAMVQADLDATRAQCQAVTPSITVGTATEFLIRTSTDVLLPQQGAALTLPGTNYILVEFLPQADIGFMVDCIYELKLRKLIPLIAHPERLQALNKRSEQAKKLQTAGALLQGTLTSLVGSQGASAREALLNMLKHEHIHSLASDYHGGSYIKLFTQAHEVLKRHLSPLAITQLLSHHPAELIKPFLTEG